jgi:hypothetical protein
VAMSWPRWVVAMERGAGVASAWHPHAGPEAGREYVLVAAPGRTIRRVAAEPDGVPEVREEQAEGTC